jgi:hypothetical protein
VNARPNIVLSVTEAVDALYHAEMTYAQDGGSNECLVARAFWPLPNVLALICSATDTEVHPRAGRWQLQRVVGLPAHRVGYSLAMEFIRTAEPRTHPSREAQRCSQLVAWPEPEGLPRRGSGRRGPGPRWA